MRRRSPFHCPMKSEYLKSMVLKDKQRSVVALLFFVCLSLLVFTPGSAQLKDQRRVTSIQLGGAAEGSRVTVVSDSPLTDYEAFRRGERFYVKIPLTDFAATAPHFRADGFEELQVQKVGDSLIVSFKLQAGATARVDQRGNRLEVIFSAPNRSSYNKSTSPGSSRTSSPQTYADRGPDAAGPMPSDSVPANRPRVVTDRAGSVNESRAPGDPRWQLNPKTTTNKNSNSSANKQSTAGSVPVASPSPFSSPSSILAPASSPSYSPLTTNTPPATTSSSSGAKASGSSDFLNWRNRQAAARQWMSANRLATLLGALILLSLIVYAASAIRGRQKAAVKTKRAKLPKVQPKYSADAELNELPNASVSKPAQRDTGAQPSAVGEPDRNSSLVLTRPTIVSPDAGQDEHSSEEEEREVFEL